ncbi:MAG: thiamine phosphate synthase [Spirochaetes bacterium]|nr:thiamine phosphate synthase [Spirochaetota bacterium]
MNARLQKLNYPLYCITAREFSNGRSTEAVVRAMLDGGAKIIQYREKSISIKQQYCECMLVRKLTDAAGATFIVNDHADIALAVHADGVHIGQDDMPIAIVRSLVGNNMIIGVSTHTPEQACTAVADGADYIGVGPLYRTNTKVDVCAPVGLAYLDYAVDNISIPFVAIGGIKEHTLSEVLAHGAKCVALVSEITSANDISDTVKRIKAGIKE